MLGGGIAQERFALLLICRVRVLALVLAAVGVYGVSSYAASRRSGEMGIRLALPAPAGAVRALIVRDGGRPTAAGVLIGLAGASIAMNALRSLLFGVSTTDPVFFAAGALTLALVALIAS